VIEVVFFWAYRPCSPKGLLVIWTAMVRWCVWEAGSNREVGANGHIYTDCLCKPATAISINFSNHQTTFIHMPTTESFGHEKKYMAFDSSCIVTPENAEPAYMDTDITSEIMHNSRGKHITTQVTIFNQTLLSCPVHLSSSLLGPSPMSTSWPNDPSVYPGAGRSGLPFQDGHRDGLGWD
jgi:hypothetical protein